MKTYTVESFEVKYNARGRTWAAAVELNAGLIKRAADLLTVKKTNPFTILGNMLKDDDGVGIVLLAAMHCEHLSNLEELQRKPREDKGTNGKRKYVRRKKE